LLTDSAPAANKSKHVMIRPSSTNRIPYLERSGISV
jgi:hypothetical protein